MYRFGKRSKDNMVGVKLQLVSVFNEAIKESPFDFVITDGVRTIEEQALYFKTGKSKTMKSEHLTGNAMDIACIDENGKVTWDAKYYKPVAKHIKAVAKNLGVAIEWGGDWSKFIDMPHFQLTRS